MQTGLVSTPFGRRSMTLAVMKSQLSVAELKIKKRVDKWKVLRDVSEARERLGIQDRALAVLDALLSFHPDSDLDTELNLVVFPSNAQLSIRAHGINGTTLRRQLAALVEAGLIQRRDSPNGKRYAHRRQDGEIEQAYGFDLSPLAVRSSELAALAQGVAAERNLFRKAKEALTICRRDARKLLTAAIEEGASGDWETAEAVYVGILSRLPRHPNRQQVEATLDEMQLLRDEIINQLEMQIKSKNMDGNAIQNGCHIQNSNTDLINESEPRSGKEQGESSDSEQKLTKAGVIRKEIAQPLKGFPLGMVLRACPQISDYGHGGSIGSWREFMSAGVVVRSMLGVSPSAYEEACDVMGPENAAVAIACILERANMINSAGGYLRDLTKRTSRGEFSLGPMLMSLLKANGGEGRLAAG